MQEPAKPKLHKKRKHKNKLTVVNPDNAVQRSGESSTVTNLVRLEERTSSKDKQSNENKDIQPKPRKRKRKDSLSTSEPKAAKVDEQNSQNTTEVQEHVNRNTSTVTFENASEKHEKSSQKTSLMTLKSHSEKDSSVTLTPKKKFKRKESPAVRSELTKAAAPLKIIQEADRETEVVKKKKRNKVKVHVSEQTPLQGQSSSVSKRSKTTSKVKRITKEEIQEKYPVLKNDNLVKKFLSVTMTNNQKGRIRQVLKDLMKGTSTSLLPEVIHNRIQTILRSSQNLTDTDLRKIRILYNMLKTAIEVNTSDVSITSRDTEESERDESKEKGKEEKSESEKEQKKKGPKRYVVFVGNLPPDVDKDQIMEHFSDLKDYIKDIRIPNRGEDKRSAIAYVELATEPSYELALSKHHSMLGSKRINVLYTTQKGSKISKAEAKGKSAKLQAMLRSGQLVGSVPLKKKRSQRRAKMKQARKAAEAAQG